MTTPTEKPLTVGFLLAHNFTLSAFSLFVDQLRLASDEGDRSRQILCRWSVMTRGNLPVRSSCGVAVHGTGDLADPAQFDYLVIVGGLLHHGPQIDDATTAYLKSAAKIGIPLVGLCTGSFILARLGLMENRSCCISWYHHQDFLAEFPDHDLVADRLFVADGNRITCAGGGGTADLATFLIERHIGRAVAQKSRHVLMLDRARAGSDAQPHPPVGDSVVDERVRRAMLLMEQNLTDPIAINDIAKRLELSTRQLERLFFAACGKRPAEFYRALRLRYAHWLLKNTDRGVTDIALDAGFADCAHFSRQFKAAHGFAPSEQRSQARRNHDPAPPPCCRRTARRLPRVRLKVSPMDIKTLIDSRKPGHALDRAFYTADDIFRRDIDVIFGRHWIYVGVEPDVAEPGDAMTVDIGTHAILVVRHDDMSIRAYHNVCRHRGARLVAGPKGSVGNIVCRYHQWTYNLDGALIFAEHMNPDFDRSCHGLKPVHLRSVAGLLFLCLAAEPPADIEDMARTLAPYLEKHDVPNTKIAAEIDLIEDGNWKVTMENNRECYHCAVSHPELTVSLFEHGFGFAPDANDPEKLDAACRYDALSVRMKQQWEQAGFPSAEIEHLADRATGFRTERLPLDGTGESQTIDTRAASRKLLGGISNPVLGGLSMWTQPNSWHHFMADHIVTFAVFPISPEKTLLRTKWLVHKDAVEGVDYTIEKLTAVWQATNAQDGALVALQQSGARTSGYEPGPYSPFTEGLVDKFTSWYISRLRAHLSD